MGPRVDGPPLDSMTKVGLGLVYGRFMGVWVV